MTAPHKVASSYWDYVQMRAEDPCPSKTASCLLELRDRLAAAEQRIRELEGPPADHLRGATEMVATDKELLLCHDQAVTDAIQRGEGSYQLAIAGRRAVYNLGRQHGAAQSTCPHIVSSDEGTSYCSLAEQGNYPAKPDSSPVPAGGLVGVVIEAIVNGMVIGDRDAAAAAILSVAEWLESQIQALSYEPNPEQEGAGLVAARWLREEVQRG